MLKIVITYQRIALLQFLIHTIYKSWDSEIPRFLLTSPKNNYLWRRTMIVMWTSLQCYQQGQLCPYYHYLLFLDFVFLRFLLTSAKARFWSINYASVTWLRKYTTNPHICLEVPFCSISTSYDEWIIFLSLEFCHGNTAIAWRSNVLFFDSP